MTHVTLLVTVRVTPGVPRSCWEHRGCAWRDDQFGRWQTPGMGWSDPTSLPREPWRSLQPSEQGKTLFTMCFAPRPVRLRRDKEREIMSIINKLPDCKARIRRLQPLSRSLPLHNTFHRVF